MKRLTDEQLTDIERAAACGDYGNEAAGNEIQDLVEEVRALRRALLEAPLASEMWKQLPNAMRLYTSELGALRELAVAVARWAEHDKGEPLPPLRHDAELLDAYEEFANGGLKP